MIGDFGSDGHRRFRVFHHPACFVQAAHQHILPLTVLLGNSAHTFLVAFQRGDSRHLQRREGAVIIVEDEFLAQEKLRYWVEKHSHLDIVATFEDGLDVLRYLQTNEVDVVFLISIYRRWTVFY